MADEHDRIDLSRRLATTVDDVWALVGEPGWFINDGQLTAHTLEWQGTEQVTVTDPSHGTFTFDVVALDPPHYVALRGLNADHKGGSRLVELWVTPEEQGTSVHIVESGFASMRTSVEEQVAAHVQNTRTWKHQLDLVQERLEA